MNLLKTRDVVTTMAPDGSSDLAYRSEVDDLPVAVLRFVDGRLVEVNAEWTALTALGIADSITDGWLDGVHPEDRADVTLFVSMPMSAVVTETDFRIVTGEVDGDCWVHARCRQLTDVGSIVRVVTASAFATAHGPMDTAVLKESGRVGLRGSLTRAKVIASMRDLSELQLSEFELLLTELLARAAGLRGVREALAPKRYAANLARRFHRQSGSTGASGLPRSASRPNRRSAWPDGLRSVSEPP